jgi:hypothetical protein
MPAFGQTKLQIINAVLPRMREGTVATSSSTVYAALVSSVLNTIRTQIEQAWAWKELRDTYTINVLPGITAYALTSSGQFAKILDIWNTTTNAEVGQGTFRSFNEKFFGATTVATGNVREYSVAGVDGNYDVQLDTWPDVSGTNVLKVNLYRPQQDPTSDSTVILAPNQVLIEGMVYYLMAERGDDNGVALQMQQQLYQDMLAGAIAAEIGHDASEVDWYPV